jgi:transposase
MRGPDTFTESLFTLRKLEDFVPADHPLRPIRQMVNAALVKMDALFSGMYEAGIKGGRPSIAPEKHLRTMLLQAFYSVRSERQLMEQMRMRTLGKSSADGVKGEECGEMGLKRTKTSPKKAED